MAVVETVPAECRGVDLAGALERLPSRIGEMFFAAGEQRLQDLDRAMARRDSAAVMDAAHSLASLTGLLHIQALADYAQDIYAAAQRGDLDAARHSHQRLSVVLGWALGHARPAGAMASVGPVGSDK
jgi:cobalamin biosynthesis protein CobD/CbiB